MSRRLAEMSVTAVRRSIWFFRTSLVRTDALRDPAGLAVLLGVDGGGPEVDGSES